MSDQELSEWRYYFSVEPTAEDKISHHIALQTATALSSQGAKNIKFTDYILDYSQKEEKKSPKDVKAQLLEQLLGEI